MFTSGSGTTETFTKDWSYSEHRHSHSEPRLLPPLPVPASCTLLPAPYFRMSPSLAVSSVIPRASPPPIHAPHPTPPPSPCPRPRRPPQPWPGHCPVQGVESVRRKVTLRATQGDSGRGRSGKPGTGLPPAELGTGRRWSRQVGPGLPIFPARGLVHL